MLEKTDTKPSRLITAIAEPVIRKTMSELSVGEEKAADVFYNSHVFFELSDKTTGLYQEPWQKIYEMFKAEYTGSPRGL